jgi:hypothetical protein
MTHNPNDPTNWPMKIHLIAHDVGRSNDRSTAVVGGHCPLLFGPRVLGVKRFVELPLGLYGSRLASDLARIDQGYNRECLIIADLSNDATYAETLFDTFGWRVIGVQIGRSGDGMTFEHRLVQGGAIRVYNVGRTHLLDLLRAQFENDQIRLPPNEESTRAYAQLVALEPEQRESGIVYKCPSGQHDDLAMSLAMLAWAARHPHLASWIRPFDNARRPPRPRVDAAAIWRGCT